MGKQAGHDHVVVPGAGQGRAGNGACIIVHIPPLSCALCLIMSLYLQQAGQAVVQFRGLSSTVAFQCTSINNIIPSAGQALAKPGL